MKRLTRFYRISWKHQGASPQNDDVHLRDSRRLRFSFFMDEPVPANARS